MTFTAFVAPTTGGTAVPTGSVTFFVDGVNRGTVALSGGQASLTLPNGLSIGTHTVRVVYGGDPNFLNSSKTETFDFIVGRGT